MQQGVAPRHRPVQAALARTTAPGGTIRRVLGSVWLVPMTVVACLGWWRISEPIMWRDELATWSAASRSVPQLWDMLHHIDAVLGVYYLGMHFWITLSSDSPAAMRVPSLLAMTGAAGLVALTGRRLGGYRAGLAGGLVFAFIPSMSRFAQEARPYGFAALFAALATLLLLRALERPTWRRWLPYALAVAAVGASHLLALCLLAGHALVLVIRPADMTGRCRAAAAGFCLSALTGIALDAPILVEGYRQRPQQIGSLLRPAASQLIGLNGSGGLWPELFCSAAVAVAVIVLAAVSLLGPERRPGAWCLACAVVPVLVIWGASQGSASFWFVRYLMFTVPAWAVAAGLGIAGLAPRIAGLAPRAAWLPAAVAVAVVALLGAPAQQAIRQPEAHNWWSYPNPSGDVPADYAGAANLIADLEQPGDGIVYQVSDGNHWMPDNGVTYYLRLRGPRTPADVFLARTPAQAGTLQPVECATPARCLGGEHRIWLVYVDHLVPRGRYRDPFAVIPSGQAAALRAAQYVIQRAYEADGITVALLVRE